LLSVNFAALLEIIDEKGITGCQSFSTGNISAHSSSPSRTASECFIFQSVLLIKYYSNEQNHSLEKNRLKFALWPETKIAKISKLAMKVAVFAFLDIRETPTPRLVLRVKLSYLDYNSNCNTFGIYFSLPPKLLWPKLRQFKRKTLPKNRQTHRRMRRK